MRQRINDGTKGCVVRIKDELMIKIKHIAVDKGVSTSRVIEEIVEQFLSK